ncbi:MerR family transcriptional regulator [Paenibacillus sp. GCM10023248]|uniref:MerR family transcriptional regulator n=1 Tax=unclassified Paenibacillus TaxID=185978 RepID=UPI003083EAC4
MFILKQSYYERRGLLINPPRSESGYRMYSNEAVEDIRFIKRAQDLGFTLDEIKTLLHVHKNED